MRKRLQIVVETPEFIRRAKHIGMTEADRADVISTLAAHPEAGVSLGGGLRKVRIARKGSGKSGGYRVLHFYREEGIPLFFADSLCQERTGQHHAERAGRVDRSVRSDCRSL